MFLGLVLYVPVLRELFRFAELHWIDLGICIAAGTVSLMWFELFKLMSRRAGVIVHPTNQIADGAKVENR